MRWVMPQPCIGSRARVLRISRSSVPCKRSGFGLVMMLLQISWRKDKRPLVDSQEKKEGPVTESLSMRRHAIQKFDNLLQYRGIAHTPLCGGEIRLFLQTAFGVILPGLKRFGIGEGADQGFSVGERGQAGAHRARDCVDVFFSNDYGDRRLGDDLRGQAFDALIQ